MKNFKLSPSILDAKKFSLKKRLKFLASQGVEYIHFDVMDGKFVEKKTFDYKYLKKFSKFNFKKDVHLMIENPLEVVEKYAEYGADIITVHYESFANDEDVIKCLNLIKKCGVKAGLSIKPDTNYNILQRFFPYADLVLVMSVEPGKGGQAFIGKSYLKISRIRQMIVESHASCEIEVDGGINNLNIRKVVDSGATMVVVGSYLFKAEDFEENYFELCPGKNI